ncbi:transglutaminase domain-containing protein [Proteiniclasticum sp. SCR006]|uniref:Transglutaminase domain-containing protein n=1 Tax=Proteiniclasticum aestuarii TaxID=2817862 RepID=A0A939KKG6_9CLOT|nr:transglutaminase-like domain-containing protein [Proteiniclasticum aestuarii]MBO1266203.1 transglutaminase domain-containing protein [Proteiniclasticum aestuarii]
MSKMKNLVIPLVMVFINMIIMAMVMESAYYIQGFQYGEIWIYAILPITIVLGLIGMLKGENIWYRLGFFFVILVSIYILYYRVKTIDVGAIPEDISIINSAIMKGEDIQFENFLNTMKLLMVVGSAILSVTLYIFPYNMVILDMGLLLFLWIVDYYNNSYEYVRFFVPIWAFSILFYRSTLYDREVKVLKVNRNKRLLQGVIFTLIITLASFFIDIEEKGIYSDRLWNFFNGQVVTQNSINGRNIEDPFSISMSGYNNSESKLGGDIIINEEEVLHAVGDGPIYLRGSVKVNYLGDRWTKEFRDYLETGSIVEEKISYYEEVAGNEELNILEIRPIKEMTSHLFNSIYTRDMAISNNLALLFYDEKYDVFTSNKTVTNDYFITYFEEELVRGYLAEVASPSARDEAFLANYEEYLQISDTITTRTMDLVFEIIEPTMSNQEKAQALTDYLKTNYTYTLEPGDLPEGEDFVDYFLFENPEGYCVYFGTALSNMLRIAGVPTRYVEGFKMADERDGGRFIVRNSDAHAWTEVLIDEENDIWQIYDATGTPRELIFNEGPEETPTEGEEPVENPETPVDEEEDPLNPQPEDEVEETPEEKQERVSRNIMLSVISALLILFALRVAYRKYKIHQMMRSSSLKPYFREVNRGLSFMYYSRKQGETYLEMADRIRDDELRESYTKLVEEVYREEYSGETGEFSRRQELYDDVYGIVREFRGPVFTFIKKFIV